MKFAPEDCPAVNEIIASGLQRAEFRFQACAQFWLARLPSTNRINCNARVNTGLHRTSWALALENSA